MEGVVHDGWLVKSPPEKRILKAKWRQRWFVLRHSGLLPGQFVLEYFTDHTCKKLKGKIDLDQCEQVDAGLTFESKKTSYQYMFDIRTPKRIYYLVAETEADMNKWVDCICSVCGLKIHIEEGSDTVFGDYSFNSLSMLCQGLLSSTTILSAIAVNNNYITAQDSIAVPVVTSLPSSELTPSVSTSSLAVTRSGSNPYIPISECHTGKPIANGNVPFRDSFGDLPKEAPPPPPKSDHRHERAVSGEFYDYPRPINPLSIDDRNRTSPELNLENLYKVPPRLKIPMTFDIDNAYNTMIEGDTWHSLPPRVNWHTYPHDSLQSGYSSEQGRTSIGSAEAVVYDLVPPVHTLNKEVESVCREAQDISIQFEHIDLNNSSTDTQPSSSCDAPHQDANTETMKAPPRPPKPSKLRDKHRYENFELPQQSPKTEDFTVYDIPPSSKGVFLSKHLPAQAFSYLKDEHDELSPSGNASSSVKEVLLDDTYDFPKFRSENNINATVPPPHSTASQRHRRHAYTNAPPGLFNSKELIFNYEYRPSLTTSDGYMSMYSSKQELYTDMSGDPSAPGTPSVIGAYANVPTSPSLAGSCQSDTPPAVNRELKPRRRFSIGEGGPPNFLTLQPPPICRSRTKATKRSFRKPRAAPSPTPLSGLNGTPPPVPTRLRHRPELSTSDDDLSSSGGSRRNSSNDEQARHFFTMPSKKNEIQYLDLDLDSEPAQSPKSPERLSASTVYKKVDFVKTKAFNEMRQNVEESYRKSQ